MEERFSFGNILLSLFLIAFWSGIMYWIISSFIFFHYPWTFVFYLPLIAFLTLISLKPGILLIIEEFKKLGRKAHD